MSRKSFKPEPNPSSQLNLLSTLNELNELSKLSKLSAK